MPSNELVEIKMKLVGAGQVAKEGEKAAKGVGKVGASSEKAAKKGSLLTRSYRKLGSAAKWAFGIIAVSGVFYLKSAVEKTTELAKVTSGLNRNLGLTIQEGSRWAAVAQAREIATTALNVAFTKMGKTFVEANRKGGTARTALNQLGITQDETRKGAHDFNFALQVVGRQLGKAHAGPQRQAAAMALLGKGYKDILPLFSEGNKSLQEQLHWADKYGVTLDGKTNRRLMDFVSAQRESKVAMLGLKVSLATALLPTLEDGQEELQKFIHTLNDPKLSAEEKLHHIEDQFIHLEDKVFGILDGMIPVLAHHWEEVGMRLVGSLWEGFKESSPMGKIVIGLWLTKAFGRMALVEVLGGKIGRVMAMSVMRVLAPSMAAEMAAGSTLGQVIDTRFKILGKVAGRALLAGIIVGVAIGAYYLGKELSKKTHGAIRVWAINSAEYFVNNLVREINSGMDKANILSFLGIDAPNIGEVNLHDTQERVAEGEHITHHPLPHGQVPPGSEGPGITEPRHGKHASGGHAGRRPYSAFGPVRPIIVQTILDGKVVAESTAHHAEEAAALA